MTIETQRHKLMCEKLMKLIQDGDLKNPWISSFIISIYKQIKSGKNLTKNQTEKLYNIFESN